MRRSNVAPAVPRRTFAGIRRGDNMVLPVYAPNTRRRASAIWWRSQMAISVGIHSQARTMRPAPRPDDGHDGPLQSAQTATPGPHSLDDATRPHAPKWRRDGVEGQILTGKTGPVRRTKPRAPRLERFGVVFLLKNPEFYSGQQLVQAIPPRILRGSG